jgi:hypothetical protein
LWSQRREPLVPLRKKLFMENETWLESMNDAFDEAIISGNYSQAKKIIEKVKEVSLEDGRSLENELLDMPIYNFNI